MNADLAAGTVVGPSIDTPRRQTLRYYPALDGLRGIAVLLVMVSHSGAPWPRSGSFGVDVFFTLSGFLITALLLQEWDTYGSIGVRDFYVRRFLRLMPCLWLTVAFVVASSWLSGDHFDDVQRDAIFSVTYVMNWARIWWGGGNTSLGHTWSLAVEEQFYFIWPAVVALLCRNVKRRHQAWLLAGVALVLSAFRLIEAASMSAEHVYFGLHTHADGLLLGSALGCLASTGFASGERVSATGRGAMVLCAVATLLGVATVWNWHDDGMVRFGYLLCAAASTGLIWDVVAPGRSFVRPALEQKPIVWLGKISYGLYLWHFPVYHLVHRIDFIWGWRRTLVVGGTASILIAAASFYGVEKRFLRLKGRFSRASREDARYVRQGSNLPADDVLGVGGSGSQTRVVTP